MISRVADHCFWLGRYLERAESSSRVLRVTSALALDGILPAGQVWGSAVTVSGEDEAFGARFSPSARGEGELVQQYLTWDTENPASIARSVSAARENARSIREVVSLEVWEAINEFHLWFHDKRGRDEYALRRESFYRRVRESTQLVLGAIQNSMLHDNAYDFISLGVLLERVGQTARILDVHHHALLQLPSSMILEETLWLSLLRACSGFEAFMKRSAGRVTPSAVAAFLVLEPGFPRSIRFCVHHASRRLASIRSPEELVLPKLESQRRLRTLEEFISGQPRWSEGGESLHRLLTHIVEETTSACEELGRELLVGPAVRRAEVETDSTAPTQSQTAGASQS
ncbi:MAG: alpha-E domain-containing protein [Myxococcaceae bacterium]